MAPCGTNHSRHASSVSLALPTTTFAPERSNHRLIDLPKRKLAVAVTASTAYVPSGRPVAAGEQGELTVGGARAAGGEAPPPPRTLPDTAPPGRLRAPPGKKAARPAGGPRAP